MKPVTEAEWVNRLYEVRAEPDKLLVMITNRRAEILRRATEPEPCEDAHREAKDFVWKLRDARSYDEQAAMIVERDRVKASQVADKRAEELRAQVETLRDFVADAVEWSKAYPPDLWPEPTPNQVDTVCRSLGFSIDRIAAMVLRGYTMRWSEKARALAATEPNEPPHA